MGSPEEALLSLDSDIAFVEKEKLFLEAGRALSFLKHPRFDRWRVEVSLSHDAFPWLTPTIPALTTLLEAAEMLGLVVAICKLDAADVAAILAIFQIFSVQKKCQNM